MGQIQSAPIELEVGSRQGGPRTLSGWNQLEATLVDELVNMWAGRDPAVVWAPEWKELEILTWADSIFLVTSSVAEAARRTREVAEVFMKKKLYFNQSSLDILPSRTAECDRTPVGLSDGKVVSWARTLQVLGCFLDGMGPTEAQVRGLLQQGRMMCDKLLCFPQIPQEERLGAFYTTVGASVLWGSRCWTPPVRVQQLISIQENRWFRCIMGGRKGYDVEWVERLRAAKRPAHALRCRLGLPALWHRALAAVHGWAGHLARKEGPHPGAVAVQWPNAEWWEIVKGTGVGSQDHSWRHPKKNWSRGFEHALTTICGLGWWEPARSDWQGKGWEFVCEAVRRWGRPGLGTSYSIRGCGPCVV